MPEPQPIDTPEHVAGYLALRGYSDRHDRREIRDPPLRELLNKLFPAGAAPTLALRPYTLGSVAHILIGISRVHLAESTECLRAVKAHHSPFRAPFKHTAAVDPTVLADFERSLITSDMYLDSLRCNHGVGGHGSAETIMPHHLVESVLRKAGWTPLRQRGSPSSASGSEEQRISSADGETAAALQEDAATTARGDVPVYKRRRQTTARQLESPINLTEPMLVRETTPEPRGTPTASELAELDAESMDLVLDSATFPRDLPAPSRLPHAGPDTFEMVQPRPIYDEAPDPHARNYDETAAELEFTLGDAAFLNVDAQVAGSQPYADDEMQLDSQSLDVDASLPQSDHLSPDRPGPDDAQLFLSLESSASPPSSAFAEEPEPEPEPEPAWDDGYDHGPAQADSADLFVPDEAAQNQHTNAATGELVLAHPRPASPPPPMETPPMEPPNSPTRDALVAVEDPRTPPPVESMPTSRDSELGTPLGLAPTNSPFIALSNSARHIPALARGIDFAIPAPPSFAASPDVSTSDDSREERAALGVSLRLHLSRELAGQTQRAIIDDDINMPSEPEHNLARLERTLYREITMRRFTRPDSPIDMREDSPEPPLDAIAGFARYGLLDAPSGLSAAHAEEPREASVEGLEYDIDNHELALLHEGTRASPAREAALETNNERPAPSNLPAEPNPSGAADDYRLGGQHETQVVSGNAVDAASRDASADFNGDGDFSVPAGANAMRQPSAETESFVIVSDGDLSDMPFPSTITSEEVLPRAAHAHARAHSPDIPSDLEDFFSDNGSDVGPHGGPDAGPRSESAPRSPPPPRITTSPEHEPSSLHASSLPSLPLLERSASAESIRGSATAPSPRTPTSPPRVQPEAAQPSPDDGMAAFGSDGYNDFGEGDVEVGFAEESAELPPLVERHVNTHTWPAEPESPTAGLDHLFTPVQRELRQSVDPSPFWQLHEDELGEYVTQAVAGTGSLREVSFTSLCENAPWRTNGIEDFNLDSDLFQAVLGAAFHKLVVLEQDTSQAESELIVAGAQGAQGARDAAAA